MCSWLWRVGIRFMCVINWFLCFGCQKDVSWVEPSFWAACVGSSNYCLMRYMHCNSLNFDTSADLGLRLLTSITFIVCFAWNALKTNAFKEGLNANGASLFICWCVYTVQRIYAMFTFKFAFFGMKNFLISFISLQTCACTRRAIQIAITRVLLLFFVYFVFAYERAYWGQNDSVAHFKGVDLS